MPNTIEVVSLDIKKVHPHPMNPRNSLGSTDLDDLASSIKAQGVLQPLTVVKAADKEEGSYYVIMGNRRLAAAKKAKLAEVPCIIREMTEEEVIHAMLGENIVRRALNTAEETAGFQMALDLGQSEEQVAEKAGFSVRTVQRRTRLSKLEKAHFTAAAAKGVSLGTFERIAEIEDPNLRQQALAAAGTKEFETTIGEVKRKDKWLRERAAALPIIQRFAKEISNEQKQAKISVGWHTYSEIIADGYTIEDACDPNLSETEPVPAGKQRYYFVRSDNGLNLYRDRSTADDDKAAAEAAAKAAAAEQTQRIKDLNGLLANVRAKWIASVTETLCDAHMSDIMAAFLSLFTDNGYVSMNKRDFNGVLKRFTRNGYDDLAAMTAEDPKNAKTPKAPNKAMFLFLASILDAKVGDEWGAGHYVGRSWSAGKYVVARKESAHLDVLYALMEKMGYELSEVEIQVRNGTHEIFDKKEETKPVEPAASGSITAPAPAPEPVAENGAKPDVAAEAKDNDPILPRTADLIEAALKDAGSYALNRIPCVGEFTYANGGRASWEVTEEEFIVHLDGEEISSTWDELELLMTSMKNSSEISEDSGNTQHEPDDEPAPAEAEEATVSETAPAESRYVPITDEEEDAILHRYIEGHEKLQRELSAFDTNTERANHLKSYFGNGGAYPVYKDVNANYGNKGLTLCRGIGPNKQERKLTWANVAARFMKIIDANAAPKESAAPAASHVDEMLRQAMVGLEAYEKTGQLAVGFDEGDPNPVNVPADVVEEIYKEKPELAPAQAQISPETASAPEAVQPAAESAPLPESTPAAPAYSGPIDDVDIEAALRFPFVYNDGSPRKDVKFCVMRQFSLGVSPADNEAFLRSVFRLGTQFASVKERNLNIVYNNECVRFGRPNMPGQNRRISWTEAEERIRNIVDGWAYVTGAEIQEYQAWLRTVAFDYTPDFSVKEDPSIPFTMGNN